MLRRRLFMTLGPLVLLLAVILAVSIFMLQGVLEMVDAHVGTVGVSGVTEQLHTDHLVLAVRFRQIVLAMSVAFLVLVSASAVVVLRAAAIVVRPVDKLIAASRDLAAGRFDRRVEMEREDEFAELGRAFNDLAARLEEAEQLRVEVLTMASRTLSHELNNAMAAIELQLELIARRSSDREAVAVSLRRIGEGLARMARTVESLKHVKRIVITDYLEGTPMLDLPRSTEAPASGPGSAVAMKHGAN